VSIYSALVCFAATLVFGLAPALHATRVDVAPLLKGGETGSGHAMRGARLRSFFLVTQFASSVALLLIAGTFVRTVVATRIGEQSSAIDHLTVAYLESKIATAAARTEYWGMVREELRRVPQVTSVTLTETGGGIRMALIPEGSTRGASDVNVGVQSIDEGFFQTVGMSLVAGRADLGGAAGLPERVAVNEHAARQFWRTTDVVGKRAVLGDVAVEVVGLVRDAGADPRVFRRLTDAAMAGANVMIRTTRPSTSMVDALRATILRLSPDRAFTRVSTYREAGLGGLHRITRMAVLIAALALSLATIGLYGSVSFVTSQRTREIAIRMAIGAPRLALLRLLAREGLIVVAIGSACGLALTAVAFQFMSGMIFARWTLDPLTVAGVLTTLSLATLAACHLPGRLAMRIEPMNVLRGD
jgi:hypothetical protein